MKTGYLFSTILIFIVSYQCARGQVFTVLSAEDGQAIPQTHLIYKGLHEKKEHVLLSSTSGEFVLSNSEPLSFPLIITIASVGYEKIQDTLYNAENKTYRMRPEAITLNEVVITGQYAPNSPEKSVHKIRVIDRKRIDLQGAQNLRDVLTNEMNIRISEDNVLGSSMSLQGISGQNVKILIDGVPVTGRLNGNVDISQLNLHNVERIEIVEGPLSVNYGTDALAGTINLITKKSQKHALSASLNPYYESSGQYNLSGRIGIQKKNTLISLNAGRQYFDGWRTSDKAFHVEKKSTANHSRFKDWKPKEQYFGTLNLSQKIKSINVMYTLDGFYEKITNRGKPRLPYYESAFDDYYRTYRLSNGLQANGSLSKHYRLNAMASYNYFQRIKNTWYKDLTTLEETLTSNDGDQDTTQFKNIFSRASISYTKDSARFNYETGYDISHETGTGLRIKNNQQEIGDYAIFGSVEYKLLQKITVRPGLRYAYNTAYSAPLIPSLNIRYTLGNMTFRGSYAKGFRAPSVKDLFFYFVDINHNIRGNESLQAEYSDNYSLSSSWQKRKGQRIYKVELSGFYNDIFNLITLAQVAGTVYSYVNIGKYKTQGVNLNTELAINHLKFNVGASYIGRYNTLSETEEVKPFHYSPELRANVVYEIKKAALSFALFYKYNGALNNFALNTDNTVYQTRIQDYHTADLSVTKSFGAKRFFISIGGKNLFDVKNISGSATGGAHAAGSNRIAVGVGRTYFIKLDINLHSQQ